MVTFTHLISKEGENNMCYILKNLFKFFKTIKESIYSNIGEFFHSKSTQWEIGHSKALH